MKFELLKYECSNLKLLTSCTISEKSTVVNISQDEQYIFFACEKEINVIRQSSGERLKFEITGSKPINLCPSNNNKFLLCGCIGGEIFIYNLTSMCYVTRLDFNNNLSFFELKDNQILERKEVINWHGDDNFFSILYNKQILYCETHTWRVKYSFKNINLKEGEFFTALSFSINNKYILAFTNLNKLIAYYIVNSEILFECDMMNQCPCYSFVVFDKSLMVSNSNGNLIKVDFILMSSIDEPDETAGSMELDNINIQEQEDDNDQGKPVQQINLNNYRYKKLKFTFNKN
jgi:hypothetical protein